MVTDIQVKQPVSAGVETEINITATYPQLVNVSDVKVYMLPNKCAEKIHIWVYVPTKFTSTLDMETWTNQTKSYSFPTEGSWELIAKDAGGYTTEITVT